MGHAIRVISLTDECSIDNNNSNSNNTTILPLICALSIYALIISLSHGPSHLSACTCTTHSAFDSITSDALVVAPTVKSTSDQPREPTQTFANKMGVTDGTFVTSLQSTQPISMTIF